MSTKSCNNFYLKLSETDIREIRDMLRYHDVRDLLGHGLSDDEYELRQDLTNFDAAMRTVEESDRCNGEIWEMVRNNQDNPKITLYLADLTGYNVFEILEIMLKVDTTKQETMIPFYRIMIRATLRILERRALDPRYEIGFADSNENIDRRVRFRMFLAAFSLYALCVYISCVSFDVLLAVFLEWFLE